jgi:hypothetical protein
MGFSYSKANRGWLTRARQRQKKVSFRSRQLTQLACSGRKKSQESVGVRQYGVQHDNSIVDCP